MKTKQLLTWKLINGKIKPSTETVQYITNWIEKHKNGDMLNAETITKKKARSLKFHKRYWGIVLPVVADYVNNMENYVYFDNNNKIVYKTLHKYLLIEFAVQSNYPEIAEIVPVYNKDLKKIEMRTIVSESFDKMNEEIMKKYISWLNNLVFTSTKGKTIDECYMEMSV